MRGDELTPWLIHYGYELGAFPMTMEDGEVEWFQPYKRALFPITGVKISHSLRKVLKKIELENKESKSFGITFDQDFESVMRGCLRPEGNWISEEFIRVYTLIHQQGLAHSAEVWRDHKLIGGLYGIAIGSVFCAESMFHRETDASKVALWAMVEQTRRLGFTIFDAQIMNPHLRSLGAYEIDHNEYLKMLATAKDVTVPWSPEPRFLRLS